MVKLAQELKDTTLAWLRNFHPELLKTWNQSHEWLSLIWATLDVRAFF